MRKGDDMARKSTFDYSSAPLGMRMMGAFVLSALMLGSASVAWAAPTYRPPALFGGPSSVVSPRVPALEAPKSPAAPVVQAPVVLPPASTVSPTVRTSQAVAVEPRPALDPNAAHNAALVDAASVAERVPVPVQDHAPLGADALLEHPADRVAPKAEPLMRAMNERIEQHASVPQFVPYGSPLTATSPATPLSGPDAVKPAPAPVVRKATTKPRMRPVVRTIKGDTPKVAIYSRDGQTGDFKRVDNNSRVVKNESRATTIDRGASMPALPLDDIETHPIAPPPARTDRGIPEFDDDYTLASQVLAAAETTPPSPDQVAPALPVPQTSAKTETSAPTGGHIILPFAAQGSGLSDDVRGRLNEAVAGRMAKNPHLRIEIRAYAPGVDGESSADRRLSLARGLAVRDYLKAQGVDPERMNVRALGKNVDHPPVDRVDVVFSGDQ